MNYSEVLASPKRPKIGVVLSSGGIRPFGGLELFAFLEEKGIPVDLLVGCSGGSIASSLRALGFKAEEMKDLTKRLVQPQLFSKLDYRAIAGAFNLPFGKFSKGSAFLDPSRFQAALKSFMGDRRLEELEVPLIIQTTDVETGEGVIFTQGVMNQVIYASSALMPFFPPIKIEGRWLADGGFSSTLPILQAVGRNMDIIIAMDFNSEDKIKAVNYLDYFNHFIAQVNQNTAHMQNALAIDTHHYEIIFINVGFEESIPMWKTEALKTVFELGKKAVEEVKHEIIKAIELFPLRV